jgi:hypothetical protein
VGCILEQSVTIPLRISPIGCEESVGTFSEKSGSPRKRVHRAVYPSGAPQDIGILLSMTIAG